jgi:hypothetical protein
MKANELLLWLSARREGSWLQFRSAIEELHAEEAASIQDTSLQDDEFPLHQELRMNLERLGHAEFFANDCDDGWRVAPPALAAICTDNGWLGILCGARSGDLLDRFVKVTNETTTVHTQIAAPDAWLVMAETQPELEAYARNAGLRFQGDAPISLLSTLPKAPTASDCVGSDEFPVGRDWTVREFDARSLTWKTITRANAANSQKGFFKFTISFQRPRYFLRFGHATRELPRALGLYSFLHLCRCRNILRYDFATHQLTLPGVCRPPSLVERTLVLCSGRVPKFNPASSCLTYHDVPKEIADRAAHLLLQALR